MDAAVLGGLITVLTPGITGVIKGFVPERHKVVFKKFIPLVPPLVGMLLGLFGEVVGMQITPDLNNAVTGLFLGAMGSTGYDAVKAQKQIKN